MHGLTRHRMAQHPQLSMTDSTEITQMSRNKNLSITRIHTETQVPRSTITKNQTTFRKVTAAGGIQSINARRAESKLKLGDGKAPMRAPVKGTMTTAMKSIMMGDVKMDDDTADWQKWEPVRDREENPTDMIITASVAKRATSAFCEVSKPGTKSLKQVPPARKNVPLMFRLSDVMTGDGPKNGKRTAPGMNNSQRTTVAARSAAPSNPTAGTSAVVGIMQNLGKMKSMNQAVPTGRPSPKPISLPARSSATPTARVPVAQPPAEPYRLSKLPQVPKNNRITPRNAYNNALPKPGNGPVQPARYRASASMDFDDENDDDDDDEDDDNFHDNDDDDDDMEEIRDFPTYNPMELDPTNNGVNNKKPPVANKPSVAKAKPPPSVAPKPPAKNGKATAGGKMGARKAASSNRFNPVPTKKQPAILAQTAVRNGHFAGKTPTPVAVVAKPAPSPVVAKKSSPKKPVVTEGKLAKMKRYVTTMPGTEYTMPSITAVSSFTKENGDQVWICLVCNEKEEEQSSRDMICCDDCEDWYHWECVGIFEAFPEDKEWYCKRCIYQHSKFPKKDFPKMF